MVKKRILVVDDNCFIRTILKDSLVGSYEVVGEARDGDDAVDKYKDLKPDLVLMDLMMPKKNGLQATKEICDYDPSAKVIMLTADNEKHHVKQAIQLPIQGYILKSAIEDHLYPALDKAFA